MGVKTRKLGNTLGLDVEWQGVQTGNFTAVSGRGYFVDTTSNEITVTLPATSAVSQGDTIVLKDYAGTWDTNGVTINRNSNKVDGEENTVELTTENATVSFIFADTTQGFRTIQNEGVTTVGLAPQYISATGGTITTDGDFKVHVFTGDGCFVVSTAGNAAGSDDVDYLVVAGGGGGGNANGGGGGGGAGGFRISNQYGLPGPTMSPLANPTGIPVPATTYPITVGAGGGGSTASSPGGRGSNGNNSVFSTITSAAGGGGGGANPNSTGPGNNGGSGGGGGGMVPNPGGTATGGTGNTPPVSPPQGNNGGTSSSSGNIGSGGGGAGAVGGNAGAEPGASNPGGPGGVGSFVSPSFAVGCAGTTGPVSSTRYFAGGGGGQNEGQPDCKQGQGGAGGGGNARATGNNGQGATANTGGGGGGADNSPAKNGGGGGSGIVILRYKFQN